MNTLTEAQRKAIIDYTTDLTRRTMEMALALFDNAGSPPPGNGAVPAAGLTSVPAVPIAPRKRGRPRKHPLPQG